MQIKNSFDKETRRRILNSFKWALSPAVVVAITDLVSKAPKSTWWGVLLAYGVPIIVNAIKEYASGEEQSMTLKLER